MNVFLIVLGAILVLDTIAVKLVSNFNLGVVLPAILGAPLFIYGIFTPELTLWMQDGFGAIVKWVALFCYAAFLISFIATILCTSLAATVKPKPGKDAIIVLGAAVRKGLPTRVLAYRLDAAYEYWKISNDTLIVVSGGRGKDEKESEAEVMKRYLVNKGVNAECILTEDASCNSRENFLFSKQLLTERFGAEFDAAYVTNRFHILRAGMAAKHVGMRLKGICAKSTWYVAFNNYLRETCALAKYIVFGVE